MGSKGRASPCQDSIDWRGPLQPVAAIMKKTWIDRTNRIAWFFILSILYNRCKTRIDGMDTGRLDLSKDVSRSHSKGVPPLFSNSLSGDRHGVVLVTVLWIMVGLSLLALTLAATVRTEATLARASGEAEQAYFFARGALEAVLYRLAYPDPDPRKQQALFPYAGGMNHYRLSSRNMRCHLALMDEAGKLDLNAAAPETLERLLGIVGASPPRAETLAAAVVARRTPGPGRRPFRFVEELLQVPGMGRELLYGRPRRQRDGRTVFQRGLMDFLTVYTAAGRVNVNYAAPEVLAALPGMDWEDARSLVAARGRRLLEASDLSSLAPAQALPFLTTQPSDTFSLVATAWLEGSATRRSLKVVARRDARSRLGHQRLVWYDQYWPSPRVRSFSAPSPAPSSSAPAARRDARSRLGHQRLVWYDQYWPSPRVRSFSAPPPSSSGAAARRTSSRPAKGDPWTS